MGIMGIDVIVGLDQPPSSEMYHVLAERFRADWPVEHSFQGKDGPVDYPRIDANGAVHTLWRYYNVGYERGPWPKIRSMIEWLWRHTESPVRYGGDVLDFDELPIITREDVDEIQRHYDAYGHEPYRAFRR